MAEQDTTLSPTLMHMMSQDNHLLKTSPTFWKFGTPHSTRPGVNPSQPITSPKNGTDLSVLFSAEEEQHTTVPHPSTQNDVNEDMCTIFEDKQFNLLNETNTNQPQEREDIETIAMDNNPSKVTPDTRSSTPPPIDDEAELQPSSILSLPMRIMFNGFPRIMDSSCSGITPQQAHFFGKMTSMMSTSEVLDALSEQDAATLSKSFSNLHFNSIVTVCDACRQCHCIGFGDHCIRVGSVAFSESIESLGDLMKKFFKHLKSCDKWEIVDPDARATFVTLYTQNARRKREWKPTSEFIADAASFEGYRNAPSPDRGIVYAPIR